MFETIFGFLLLSKTKLILVIVSIFEKTEKLIFTDIVCVEYYVYVFK